MVAAPPSAQAPPPKGSYGRSGPSGSWIGEISKRAPVTLSSKIRLVSLKSSGIFSPAARNPSRYSIFAKASKFVLPILRDALAADGPVDGLALEVVLWCRYCTCVDEANNTIEAIRRPGAFLEFSEVFGSLSENPQFSNVFARWLKAIHENRVRATIRQYLKD